MTETKLSEIHVYGQVFDVNTKDMDEETYKLTLEMIDAAEARMFEAFTHIETTEERLRRAVQEAREKVNATTRSLS